MHMQSSTQFLSFGKSLSVYVVLYSVGMGYFYSCSETCIHLGIERKYFYAAVGF